MLQRHYLCHDLNRAFPIEALARSDIQFVGNGIQLLLAVHRQVRALGQVLADQAVDVLVAAALPGAVWVAEVDRHTGLLGDFRVPRHLSPLVVGHALAYSQRHAVQRRAEALHRRGRRRIVHLRQDQVAAGTLDQGGYRRGVGLALDQIALPVTGHQAVFDLRWAYVDADHVGDLATSIHPAGARPAGSLALPQTDDQLLAQLADRQGIDRVVDCLAADVGVFEAWGFHGSQLAGNLLGRKALSQQVGDQLEQLVAGHQPFCGSTDHAACMHQALGIVCNVLALSIPVAPDLTADRRGAAVHQPGKPALAEAIAQADLDRDALCGAEFVIGHGATPYRNGRVLHSVFAAAFHIGGGAGAVPFAYSVRSMRKSCRVLGLTVILLVEAGEHSLSFRDTPTTNIKVLETIICGRARVCRKLFMTLQSKYLNGMALAKKRGWIVQVLMLLQLHTLILFLSC